MRKQKEKSLKTKEEIFKAIQDSVIDLIEIDEADVQLSTNPVSVGIDSLDVIEIIMWVEEELNIEIHDEHLTFKEESFEEIVDKIYKNQ